MLYNKFINRHTVTARLIAVDAIHIGSLNDPAAADDPVLKDSRGCPVIPGASLKGVVRSYFESALRSADIYVCDVFDENNCCTCGIDKELEKIGGEEEKALHIYERCCPSCRLFGNRHMAGRLIFRDCGVIGDFAYEHRDGVSIDRETGAARLRLKFGYETVPKGTEFSFCMTAENIDREQEKYLDFIIGAMKSGSLSVGGKTSRGLGRFMLEDVRTEVTDAAMLRKKLGL